jgi:hypothetical protein
LVGVTEVGVATATGSVGIFCALQETINIPEKTGMTAKPRSRQDRQKPAAGP